MPKPAFWGLDNGIKYQGSRAFAETGKIALTYDGVDFDAKGGFRPIAAPFSEMHNGKQIPTFPPLFMLIGGIFYLVMGRWGPFLLPLIGGWLTLLASWLLWQRQRGDRDGRFFLLIVGLGTPILFYSLELWEHSLTAGFLTLSIMFTCAQHRIHRSQRYLEVFLGGIFFALAVSMRSELLLWGCVTLLLWPLTGHSLRTSIYYLFGAFTVILLVMLLNYWQTGYPIPQHISANFLEYGPRSLYTLIVSRMQNVYKLLLEGFPANHWSMLGVIPLLMVGLWSGWRYEEDWWMGVGAAVLAAWGVYFYQAVTAANVIAYTAVSGGLLWTAPMTALVLLPFKGERRRFWKFLWYGSALFIVLTAAIAPSIHGIHWSQRLLVPILPVMMMIAATRGQRWWRRYPHVKPVIILFLIISIVGQVFSYVSLQTAHRQNAALNRWVTITGAEVTITPMWWLAGDCALVSYNQPWYLIRRNDQLPQVLQGLRERGVKQAVYIENQPYLKPELWWSLGVERQDDDHFFGGDRRLRKTRLKIIGMPKATAPSAAPD